MPRVRLDELVRFTNRVLQPEKFEDWDKAENGLQLENNGRVTRLAAAVDASLATVTRAIEQKADLLLVHHGFFWSKTIPWTGPRYRLLEKLISNNLAVYSSHLPLDAHPKLGNNILLARGLGLKNLKPFFFRKGQALGWRGNSTLSRKEMGQRLGKLLGREPILLPGGKGRCDEVGVVTGGAGAELALAAAEGVDTFITGEGPHWTFALAEEAGINVFYGGHYATETFGVKALAEHLSRKFKIPWVFIDHPTGL